MQSLGLMLSLFLLVLIAPAQERKVPIVLSTAWLADHLQDPDVVVLHVAFSRKDYALEHIPGARFVWYSWLAVSTPDASTEMPTVEQADTLLESLGLTSHSTVVLCFSRASVTPTTRILLALSYFGFGHQVSLLDGGLEAWKSEGRPVSTEVPAARRTSLNLATRPEVIVDADWLRANLSTPSVSIIDARDRNFYKGEGGGILRQGHIRGAVSIPFSSVLDSTNRVKNLAELHKVFEDAGITRGKKVVTYCHVGQQATLVYTVARLLGYDAAVYDGSFEDWNVRGEEYPVQK
jgi:thiosulfate/3-mercaptopyruvate sulfurtransferase